MSQSELSRLVKVKALTEDDFVVQASAAECEEVHYSLRYAALVKQTLNVQICYTSVAFTWPSDPSTVW